MYYIQHAGPMCVVGQRGKRAGGPVKVVDGQALWERKDLGGLCGGGTSAWRAGVKGGRHGLTSARNFVPPTPRELCFMPCHMCLL